VVRDVELSAAPPRSPLSRPLPPPELLPTLLRCGALMSISVRRLLIEVRSGVASRDVGRPTAFEAAFVVAATARVALASADNGSDDESERASRLLVFETRLAAPVSGLAGVVGADEPIEPMRCCSRPHRALCQSRHQ
jgi:hypothetical protein